MAATGNEPDIRTINATAMTTTPTRNARRSPTLFPVPGGRGIRRVAESTGGPHDLGTSEPPVSDHPADGRSHRHARGRPRVLPRADAQARDSAEDVGAAPPVRGRDYG